MIIIVEGRNGGGKSTLINSLKEKYSDFIFEPSKGKGTVDEAIDIMATALDRSITDDVYVYDRINWISEPVYSEVMEREPLLPLEYYKRYWDVDQLIIYCNPTKYNVCVDTTKHVRTQIETNIILTEGLKLQHCYNNILMELSSHHTVIDYDYMVHPIDDIFKLIDNHINSRKLK